MVYSKIFSALKGWSLWRRIIKKYKIKITTAVILMPSDNLNHNILGLVYLDEFLVKNNFTEAIIITADEKIKNIVNIYSTKIREVCHKPNKDLMNLVTYYDIVYPDRRLILLSLFHTFARRQALKLLNEDKMTMEDLIAIGIYKLHNFERKLTDDILPNENVKKG